jgi:hypothetical protein
MSRKDYIAIAAVIKSVQRRGETADWAAEAIASELAVLLKQDNPRFDMKRFHDACGLVT